MYGGIRFIGAMRIDAKFVKKPTVTLLNLLRGSDNIDSSFSVIAQLFIALAL